MTQAPRHVLVTGGSSGIGAALVRRFHTAGDAVTFTYRSGADPLLDRAIAKHSELVGFLCQEVKELVPLDRSVGEIEELLGDDG